MTPTEVVLRPAEPADTAEIVAVHLASRADAVRRGLMPAAAHPDGAVREWLGARLVRDEVWVAESDVAVTGYVRLTSTWVDDLYVHPSQQRRGIATALLRLAMSLRPDGLGLYVFETNHAARTLYEHNGFVVMARSDGSENEERAPDLRMEWPGARSL